MLLIFLLCIAVFSFLIPKLWPAAHPRRNVFFALGAVFTLVAVAMPFVTQQTEDVSETSTVASKASVEQGKSSVTVKSDSHRTSTPDRDLLGDKPFAKVTKANEKKKLEPQDTVQPGVRQLQLSLRSPTYMSIPAGKALNVANLNCDVLVRFEDKTTVVRRGSQQSFKNSGKQASRLQLELISNNVVDEDGVRSSGLFSSAKERRQQKAGCRAVYSLI